MDDVELYAQLSECIKQNVANVVNSILSDNGPDTVADWWVSYKF